MFNIIILLKYKINNVLLLQNLKVIISDNKDSATQ